jgi:hypothetical protein
MRHHVGVAEVASLEQQWRLYDRRDGISHAIAEIQPRRVSARPAEGSECL